MTAVPIEEQRKLHDRHGRERDAMLAHPGLLSSNAFSQSGNAALFRDVVGYVRHRPGRFHFAWG
jgi:hypothetical protein